MINIYEERFSFKEEKELLIKTLITNIPYAGSFADYYYNRKDSLDMKKLNIFVEDFKNRLSEIEAGLYSDNLDPIFKYNVLGKVFEKVRDESINDKLIYLRNALINSFTENDYTNKYDKIGFHLDNLSNMTLLECNIILHLYKEDNHISIEEMVIQLDIDEPFFLVGTVNKLKSYGYLESWSPIFVGSDPGNEMIHQVKLSEFGRSFINFCLIENTPKKAPTD